MGVGAEVEVDPREQFRNGNLPEIGGSLRGGDISLWSTVFMRCVRIT